MIRINKRLYLLVLLSALSFLPGMLRAEDWGKKLALSITDNDEVKMTSVLNVAANVSRYYNSIGEEVDIQIVAYNAGLAMLRADQSPVYERIKGFTQSMPNVTFIACGNTIDTLTRKEGVRPPILEEARVVVAGVVELIELDNQGYTLVRP